jgi:hypothetical protein
MAIRTWKSVKIGDVTVLASLGDWAIKPDDRQKKIDLIDGVTVEDYGRVKAGDTISGRFRLTDMAWDVVAGYWENRTKVILTDEGSREYTGRRVVVTAFQYLHRFPYAVEADIEFWNI